MASNELQRENWLKWLKWQLTTIAQVGVLVELVPAQQLRVFLYALLSSLPPSLAAAFLGSYALDDEMSAKLRRSNPEAFQNVLKRLLEAKGRGYWDPDDDVLERIQQQYADVEDDIELGTGGRVYLLLGSRNARSAHGNAFVFPSNKAKARSVGVNACGRKFSADVQYCRVCVRRRELVVVFRGNTVQQKITPI